MKTSSQPDRTQTSTRDSGEGAPSKLKAAVAGHEGYAAQAAAVATNGGTWNVGTFAPFDDKQPDGTRKVGALMNTLKFTPAAPVVSNTIKLVQTSVSKKTPKGGKATNNYGNDPIRAQRATEDGVNIDKAAGSGSPYFADPREEMNGQIAATLQTVQADKNADALRNKTLSPMELPDMEKRQATRCSAIANTGKDKNAVYNASQVGHRKADGETKDATLKDKVGTTWVPGEKTVTTFETTALVLEGKNAGTYLGSVSWGLEVAATEDAPSVTLKPLALKEMGPPTQAFDDAAAKWNAADPYTTTMYYDKVATKGAPYLPGGSSKNGSTIDKEYVNLAFDTGVPAADKVDGVPNADKWGTAAFAVTNQKMPVMDRALYDTYLAKAKATNGDGAGLERVHEELASAAKKAKKAPDVVQTTWANIEFELQRLAFAAAGG